ncbi:MAG: PIN domain-containing protein [Chloroflexi bacterium]|nr:PIN domain-containing protein [Chloroflexota bacterium]
MSVFVDTNVLVYARDPGHPEKQERSLEWLAHLWASGDGRVSTQVLNEYYATVTRRLAPGLPQARARADVEALFAWDPQPVDRAIVQRAFEIGEATRIPHWDALIVAAAHAAGCTHLLSEDLSDGQRIDAVTVISPFTHTPDMV